MNTEVEIYNWANSIGNVEWTQGADDTIVNSFKELIERGFTEQEAKTFIESLVADVCAEVDA